MKPNVPSENLLKNCLTHHTDSALGTLRKVKTGSTGGLWSSGGRRLKFCMWGGMTSWSRAGWVAPGQKDLGVAVIIKMNMSRSAPATWIRRSAYWATLVEVRPALTFACAWTCHCTALKGCTWSGMSDFWLPAQKECQETRKSPSESKQVVQKPRVYDLQ